jgi:pimeloyl-ACP methyl ester carboxylesterase
VGRGGRGARLVAAGAVTVLLLAAVLLARSPGSGPQRAEPASRPSAPAPSTPAPSAPSPPDLTWTPCGEGFSCTTLDVPVDEDDPALGTVPLALTRLPAADPANRVGSIVVNPGGPGLSAVDALQATWAQVLPVVRERFDLVAFDPRAVGRSAPLRCATTVELDRAFALDPSPDDPGELAALVEANAALATACARSAGRLLGHLGTDDAVADLERVRVAVGDERLTYLGYSYGTTIGAAYLDRFPDRVRAMVLDSPFPPSLTWDEVLTGQATGFERALEAFLEDCEQTSCAFRGAVRGDLGQAYDRLVARVDGAPLPGDASRELGPGELFLAVLAALYDRESGWPALAAGLAAAQQGDGAPLLALADSYLGRGPEGYSNVNEASLAVGCSDRQYPDDPAAYVALADELEQQAPRFGQAVALTGTVCAAWPAGPQERPEPVRAEGAPPVLVIGTTGDPATPYDWAVELAERLESGVLLTHRGQGHTVYGVDGPPCVVEAVDDYLFTLEVPEPRTC